jgi:hypothetical protein
MTENSNESYASASIIWLIGWAFVLPFAHPWRLLSYGFLPLVLLIGLSILFPSATVFAPILVSTNFAPRPLPDFAPLGSPWALVILLLSFVVTASLLCFWQRDILRRFRDPLSQLVVESIGRMAEYLGLMLTWAICLGGIFIWTGSVAIAVAMAVAAACFARILFMTTLVVSEGWKTAFAKVWSIATGRVIGSLLMLAVLGLVWLGMVALGDSIGIRAALRGNGSRVLLLADAFNVAVTLLTLLWLTAISALTIRVSMEQQPTAASVFD